MLDASPPSTLKLPARPWTAREIGPRVLLAVVAGLLHGGGWVYPGLWWSVWLGQAALLLLGLLCAPRGAFLLGSITGGIGIAISFAWAVEAMQATLDAHPILAVLIFSGLVLFEALGFGLFCAAVSVASRRGPWALWVAPCVWAAVEYWHPRIFPWMMGYSQLEVLPLLQIAELTGPTGIGFVMTAAVAGPAALLRGWLGPAEPAGRAGALGFALSTTALLAATLLFGLVRQDQSTRWAARQPRLNVALLQVNVTVMGSDAKLREMSLALDPRVDLICWPECAIGIYSEELTHFRDIDQTRRLSRDSRDSLEPAKALGRPLLAGGKLYRPDATEDGPYSMTAFLISPSQQILGRYKKRTLLPFGEYVPGQAYFPAIRQWATLREVLEAGTDPQPLVAEGGAKLGVLICYEDILPGNARETVAAGAEVLFSLIQGAAFKNPLTLKQHQRLAVLRAVENRRYFARCASTGETCVIDPTGRLIAELPPHTEGVLTADLALLRGRTCYNLIGDLFPWSCLFLSLAWYGRKWRMDNGQFLGNGVLADEKRGEGKVVCGAHRESAQTFKPGEAGVCSFQASPAIGYGDRRFSP